MGKNFDGAAPGPRAAANGVCTCKYFYVESETSSVSMHQLLFCRCPNKLGKFIKTNYCENDEWADTNRGIKYILCSLDRNDLNGQSDQLKRVPIESWCLNLEDRIYLCFDDSMVKVTLLRWFN